MGKKKHRDQGSGIGDQKVEKQITGSGADVERGEDAASTGKVKCKCIVPCVWRGYRDEGDTVWIEKELVEKDAFIRMHFKAVDGDELFNNSVKGPQGDPKGAPGSDNADGSDANENHESDNGNGESDNADDGSDNADSGSDNADGADGNGEGQGELNLK